MIPVPDAVVHEGAVVIELLDTSVAEVAVHGYFGAEILAVDANVVQVVALVYDSLK